MNEFYSKEQIELLTTKKLGPDDQASVETHVDGCLVCQKTVAAMLPGTTQHYVRSPENESQHEEASPSPAESQSQHKLFAELRDHSQYRVTGVLVHRDIKPANLLVSPAGVVKILDLGLATLKAGGTASELTTEKQFLGTVDYAAPEQWESNRDVDIRADIYSLGCTLYYLLVGQAPFPSSKYNTTMQQMWAHSQAPRPPIRDLRPDVPESVAAVVDRMLAKSADERFASPAEVAEWIGAIPDVLAKRLVAVGLIAPREKRQEDSTKFGEFIDAYLVSRTDIKPRTRINLLQVRKNLVTHFGEDRLLGDITLGDADEWRGWLLGREKPLGANTVRRHCGRVKQLFRAAMRKRLIAENPFADMRDCSVRANRSREFFLRREDAEKVLAACPDHEWRLIFALARFGGLRTPSETLLLRWADVDWERGRLLIRSPKTEHHEGKDSRLVPIFPELRPHLEAAWDHAHEGAEFVIARRRDSNINLRTQLLRIIAKAGLTSWPKLFQNLRATRETELAETYPLHVVVAWLGNSQLVAAKHYLQVTDEHFAKATHNQTHSVSGNQRTGRKRGRASVA